MTKKKVHHRHAAPFDEKRDKQSVLLEPEQKKLTAEGFKRRHLQSCESPRSRSLYRGRRRGKTD